MDKIFNSLLTVSLFFLLIACGEEEFSRPPIDLELTSNEVLLNIMSPDLTTGIVTVRHGNSGYVVTTSDESVATVSNEEKATEFVITAIGEGSAVITVTDAIGKTATIDVTVSVSIPSSATFTWNGENVDFDKIGGYGITVLTDKIALTDIINDNKQYILSWSEGLSEGDKSNGILKIIGSEIETEIIELTSFKVLNSESSSYYIIFNDENGRGGQIYFTK